MTLIADTTRVNQTLPGFPSAEPYLSTIGAWILAEAHSNATVDTAFGGGNGINYANFPDLRGMSVRVGWCDLWPNGGTAFNSSIWDYAKATYASSIGAGLYQTRFMMGTWTPQAVYSQYGGRSYQPSSASTTVANNAISAGANQITFTSAPAGYNNNKCVQVDFGGVHPEYITIGSGAGTTTWTLAGGQTFVFAHNAGITITEICPVPFDINGNADTALLAAYKDFLPAQTLWHINNNVKWMHISHYGRDFAEINAEQNLQGLQGWNYPAWKSTMQQLLSLTYAYCGWSGPYSSKLYMELPLTGFGATAAAAVNSTVNTTYTATTALDSSANYTLNQYANRPITGSNSQGANTCAVIASNTSGAGTSTLTMTAVGWSNGTPPAASQYTIEQQVSIGTIDTDYQNYVKNTLTNISPFSTVGGDAAHIAIGINNVDDTNNEASGWSNFRNGHHGQMVGVVDYAWDIVWGWGWAKVTSGVQRVLHSNEIYYQSWQTGKANVTNGALARHCTRFKGMSTPNTADTTRIAS